MNVSLILLCLFLIQWGAPKTVIEPLDNERARVSSVLHRKPVVLPILSEDADPSNITTTDGGGFGSFVRLQDHLSAEAVQVLAGKARRYRSGNQLLIGWCGLFAGSC